MVVLVCPKEGGYFGRIPALQVANMSSSSKGQARVRMNWELEKLLHQEPYHQTQT